MPHSTFTTHNGVGARLALAALCVLQLAVVAACAKTKAADLVPDGPPLAMSEPPPRVIAPVEAGEVAPPSPPVPETPATAPVGTANAKPTPRPPAQPRPNTAATETPPAATAQPTPPPPAAPPLEVRSVSSPAEEKKVRDLIARVTGDLGKINYQRLNAESKAQYDQAKRFAEQADGALKEKNIVYAMQLAENAATFAAQVAGR